MEKVASKYVGVHVMRTGLKSWLFSCDQSSGLENVKTDLIHQEVPFTSEEVFVNNSFAMEVTLLQPVA